MCTSDEKGGQGGDSGKDASSGAAGGSAGSGGSASDAQDARDSAGELEAATCSPTPVSKAIPADWVRFPGLPCKCDIWVAATADQMGPPPSWITRPSGVLELENNWADYSHRIISGSAVGDSVEGQQLMAFGRDLGQIDGTFVNEWIAARLPGNEIVFRARVPDGYSGLCLLYVKALGQGNIVHLAFETVSGVAPKSWAVAGGRVESGVPDLLYAEKSGKPGSTYVVGSRVIASVRYPGERIDAFKLGVPNSTPTSIGGANAGRAVDLVGAWDSTVFFMEYGNDSRAEIWAWDDTRGLRRFLPRTGDAPGQVGSVCGLGTDGETLVWTQYSGWNGNGWDRADIMKAPFTIDETAIKPVSLRAASGGDGFCRTWRVGGGYAAARQSVVLGASTPEETTVVRISDGRAWQIPDRLGWSYGVPLYVTADEIAMEEDQTEPNDAGVVGQESWTIVRYPLSLLGPGTAAAN